MIRNLRSNRTNKEAVLKKGQIILCSINGEYMLYKLEEDWKNGDATIAGNELIEIDKKKNNKSQYQCQANKLTKISVTSKWIKIEGVSINKLDGEIYIIDQEMVQQAIRGLLNESKAKIQQTHQKLNNDNYEISPQKSQKSNTQLRKKQVQPIDFDKSSESSSYGSSDDEEPVPKKQRQSRKQVQRGEKKGKKSKRKISKNQNYTQFVTVSKQLEDGKNDFQDYQSSRMNNKEVIRAATTGNRKLMENIFNSEEKVSNLEDRWGPENDVNVIEILLKRQDKDLLTYYLQNKSKVHLCQDLPCQLQEIDTGYNDKQAYGVRLRRVTLGRGCREGNNAFVYDLGSAEDEGYYQSKKLLEIETDPKMLEILLIHGKKENYEDYFQQFISQAVRCGNIKTAQAILKHALATNNQNGYGFNYLHRDALGDDFGSYDVSKIKKVSMTKKTFSIVITPIHCACINPSEQFLKYFMEQTMQYNLQDEIHRKPVHYAAVSQTSACLEYLIENCVDVREGDKFLNTPLMLAAQCGRAHNVKLLCHTNLKAKNKEGNTAIHLASQNGHVECVKLLLQAGVLINLVGKNRMTPLHFACAYNHLELMEFLLDEGARINAKDKFGRTPLVLAARNGNFAIVSKLLYYGADLTISDSSSNAAIHYAAAYGFLECVEHLILAGADQNQFNSWKLKPLNVALAKNHFGIVKALIKYENTDVNCVDDDGLTLVAGLIKNFNNSQAQFDFIEYLIKEKKANISLQDKFGNTCLSHAMNCASSQLQIDLIKLLIQNGADINANEKNTGLSPFQLCLQNKNYSLVEMIVCEFKPNINVITAADKTVIHTLIENKFFFDDQGMKLFNILIDQVNESLLNLADADGFVPLLRLLQVFIKNIDQQIQANYSKRVAACLEAVWKDILQEFSQKEKDASPIDSNYIYAFQCEIQNRLQTHGRDKQSNYFGNSKISVRIGITQEEQINIEKQKAQDGYLYQNRIVDLMKQFILKGADIRQKIQRQKLLRDKNNTQGSPNEGYTAFHFLFQAFPSSSFLEQLLIIFPREQLRTKDSFGQPLHYFIKNCSPSSQILFRNDESHESFLNYLISVGIDFKEKNIHNETPTLMIALKYTGQYQSMLQQLIGLGGQINEVNTKNQVPLHYFVQQSDISVVKILLHQFHADPNFQDLDGRTALHYAINYTNSNANASFQMEQELIKHGAKCDARDNYQRTPLFYAFTKFNDPQGMTEIDPFESVSSLLAFQECDVNALDKYQRSPLHYAALRGSAISGRYMIKLGAKLDEPDTYNNTPMAYAFFKHANFSTMMIDNKADIHKFIHIVSLSDFKGQIIQKYRNQLKDDPDIDTQIDIEYQESIKTQSKMVMEEEKEGEDIQKREIEIKQQQESIKQRIISKKLQELIDKDKDILQLLHNNMNTGQHSYFSQAIRQGWQGVAYLLISDGYEFIRAIEDAINENQFQLVLTLLIKVKNIESMQQVNQFGQNLFHLFAKQSNTLRSDIRQEIIEQFELKSISPYLQDQYYKSPLHYAVQRSDSWLINYFTSTRKCDPNLMDYSQNSPFTIAFQFNPYCYFEWYKDVNFDVEFKIIGTEKKVKPLLYLIEHKLIYSIGVLKRYIDRDVDVNEQNEKGHTALTIAIKNNNIELLEIILFSPNFNKVLHQQDKEGKTPIHHVVLPLEFGSYENLKLLQLLLDYFDYNQKDNQGLTPLDYALIFDAQIMKEELLKKNADHTRSLRQQRMPTSIIATAEWPDVEIDFEDDAQRFQENLHTAVEIEIDTKSIVDSSAKFAKADLNVYEDPEFGLFSCLLSKVDIINRNLHQNVFYKMQLLFDSNRSNYILFTKWGQIGTDGQFQLTPFENLETTMKEYCKIFSQKTGGNDWRLIKRGEGKFEKKHGKYQLIDLKNSVNFKSILQPFNLSKKSPYPKCQLDQNIQTVIEQFSQVKLYQQQLQQYSFDLEFVPLEKLDRDTIIKAKEYLLDLKELLQETEQYKLQDEVDLEKLQQYYQEINERSARYYELIPQTQLRQNVLPLIESEEDINKKLELIELLLNIEFSVKILLGANLKLDVIHPLTYCFNALNIKMLALSKEDLEYKMILAYAQRSASVSIANIFAIERKGEAQQFGQHTNGKRYLLWHGSKISNYMSLLAIGLKIAPSWAVNTGALYGKGIYFADQLQKSYAYTEDYTIRNRFVDSSQFQDLKKFRYVLLCEVSASNQIDIYQNQQEEDLTQLIKPDVTLKVVGSQGPDEQSNIRMPNGCIVPIGNVVSQSIPDNVQSVNFNVGFKTSKTEYIVYNESKVRMRYLIQIQ